MGYHGGDAFVRIMRAIADQGVDLRIDDAMIHAGVVGTGEAFSSALLRSPTSALEFPPRSHRRRWHRCGCRSDGLATACKTIVRRARLEHALVDRGDRRVVPVRAVPTSPKHNQAKHADHQRDDQPAEVPAIETPSVQEVAKVG